MEPVGAFLDEEWASLIRMFSGEDTDLGTHWPSNEANMNNDGPVDEALMFHFSDTFCSDLHHFSRESSNTSGSNNSVSFPTPSHENYCSFTDSNHFDQETNNHNHNSLVQTSMDFGVMDNRNNSSFPIFADNCVMEDILTGGEKLGNGDGDDQVLEIDGDSGIELQLKRKLDAPELHAGEEEKRNESATQTPKKKKKSRVSGEAQKEKRKAPWRKNQKLALHGNDEEETNNAGRNVQNSSCCSSDDDSSAFDHQELNNGGEISDSKLGFSALNSKGKTRASRGTATDPQSLYARV
ncbi:hypothetical protein U1Q18_016395 [Sarracenia purpurea var. burkii]